MTAHIVKNLTVKHVNVWIVRMFAWGVDAEKGATHAGRVVNVEEISVVRLTALFTLSAAPATAVVDVAAATKEGNTTDHSDVVVLDK